MRNDRGRRIGVQSGRLAMTCATTARRSSSAPMVVAKHATKAFAAFHRPIGATDLDARCDYAIAETLMIALEVVMLKEGCDGAAQRVFAEK
jgi:hypothetical protein